MVQVKINSDANVIELGRRFSMSEIILDTITGKSTATTVTIGSTPVVSASANSMTIRGEGSNQTSIQQGLVKFGVIVKHACTIYR